MKWKQGKKVWAFAKEFLSTQVQAEEQKLAHISYFGQTNKHK